MALSIKAAEADWLARLTGETMTEALRERLVHEKLRREETDDLPARLEAFARRIGRNYDTRPVTPAEWDEASGDTE